jgi:hypothetical protein
MVSEEGARHVQSSPQIAVEVGIPVVAFYNEIKTGIEHAAVEDDPLRWSKVRKVGGRHSRFEKRADLLAIDCYSDYYFSWLHDRRVSHQHTEPYGCFLPRWLED